jgi:hypothetical protein
MRHEDIQSLSNELEKYKTLAKAQLGNTLRGPRLLGLVRDESGLAFELLSF